MNWVMTKTPIQISPPRGAVFTATMEREKLVDIGALADHLGVQQSTIYSWTHYRKIPFYKTGRLVRFKISEVEACLLSLPQTKPQQQSQPPGRDSRNKDQIRHHGKDSKVDRLIEMAMKEAGIKNTVL